MSEQNQFPSDGQSCVDQASIVMSAGTLLRVAREAQGLHIGALAVALRVPVKKLEALEADRFDLLPDTVFVRALASSVCRALKIDHLPVLAILPQSEVPHIKSDDSGLNASFRTGGQSFGTDLMVHLTKPMAIAILALCLGILAIIFIPTRNTAEIEPDSVSTVQKAPILKVAPAASLEQPTMPLQIASDPQAPQSESVTKVESKSVSGVLALQAQGESWVEVTDANGILQLRKILNKGEIVQVSGVLPLSVVLGRADLVGVSVRGQALDVMSLAKDNVARFEVK